MIGHKGWRIPEGNVVQVKDAGGAAIWKLETSKPVVLEVEKITSDTYAGETTYTGEEFILLDIYPKTNGTVSVTYGGLTKTITDTSGAEEPNAQKVFFGTFNGVSDTVAIPTSGTLTIEGGCDGFAIGTYSTYANSKTTTQYCSCINSIVDWGSVTTIPACAFYNCSSLALTSLPSGITRIGSYAFHGCTSLTITELPSGITSIGSYAFEGCTGLTNMNLSENITSIGNYAFHECSNLALTSLPSGITSIGSYAFYGCTSLALSSLPSGITSISNYSFYGCKNITLTSLPSGITNIGDYAFFNCYETTFSALPEGVTTVGMCAFYFENFGVYGGRLEELTLPSTLTTIGSSAFSGKYETSLSSNSCRWEKVIITPTTPPSGTSNMFGTPSAMGNAGNYKLFVPKGCGDVYKTSEGWSAYADYITEVS